MKTFRMILGMGLMTLPLLSQAQTAAKLTAEQILDKYVAATGGRAAYEKLKTLTMNSTLTIKSQGISGTVEMTAKAPNKVLEVANLAVAGTSKQGFDGKTGWSQDFNGLRKMEGTELADFARRAQFNEPLNYKTIYSKIVLVGKQKMGGKDVYVIKKIPKTGNATTEYYDAKTFLIVKMETVSETPQGTFPAQTLISEYKTVDGLKFPSVMQQKIGTVVTIDLRFTEIKLNPPVDDKIFAMPEKAEGGK